MKGFFGRIHKPSLIETLILVAILGILASVIAPNFTGFVNETDNIQEAVTEMMQDKGLTSLSRPIPWDRATNNMMIFPEAENPLYPLYWEEQFTKWNYYMENGRVHRK